MAEQWQIRKGTTTQNNSFTGAVGELTMDTELNEVHIHDGTTQGGHTFANKDYIDTLLNTIYPVGAIYIGTQSTCPMDIIMPGTTWTLVSSDKALWTGDGTNANTTIAAGLPNITGQFRACAYNTNWSGAFANGGSDVNEPAQANWIGSGRLFDFNASRSSSIYGNSTTVQPPAYVVNVWRRDS